MLASYPMLARSRKRGSQKSTSAVTLTAAQKQRQFLKTKRTKQLEFQPEATTKERSKKDRNQEELPNKLLGLCLASYGGSSVSYYVLSFRSIGSSDQSLQLQEIQFPSSDDGDCFGMGFGVVGSNLYVLGGQRREKKSSYSGTKGKHAVPLPRYSLYDYNPKVFMLDLATNVASQIGEMLSGMASPLIIVVEGKLYVLAGTPVSMLPKHPFEVHDPKTNSWEKLLSPPFLRPDSKFFQDPQFQAYVVIGNKIHVSTSSSSFTFNTATKNWTPCTLFDENDQHLKLRRRPWIDIRYPTHFDWMNYPLNNDKDEQGCGFPFDFDGGAVMYDGDVLICLVPSKGVVAYKLVGGKVMDTQVLEGLEILLDVTFAYLADFGEGYFYLLTVSNDDQPKQDCQICITPFQVSKNFKYGLRQRSKMTKILNCCIGKKLIHSTEQLAPHKIWSPIGCFVV
ncbi:hypothetical protein ACSBR1_014419 [Camellia fascicularis]